MIEPFQRRNLFEAHGLCIWYTFFFVLPDTRWLQRRREEDMQGVGEKEERKEIRKRREEERREKRGKGK